MTFKKISGAGLTALAALTLASGALAQTAAPTPKLDTGDTAWMLTSTVIVLLMTLPGLALFYGGMVRKKNVLSVVTACFAIACLMSVLWMVYGYSIAFTESSMNAYIGGFSKAMFAGVTSESLTGTIPEWVFITFQMTFAIITPALIIGAFVERIKFSALLWFIGLWGTFVYFPVAHWVWGGGFLGTAGVLDFAGGTVVHINAGIAALVGAIMVGKRIGYGKDLMSPHSMTLTFVGGALLWIGWFGFNAGSALTAGPVAALALVNTLVATAAAALGWLAVEWAAKGKPSMLGTVSGVIAGLVAITPAAGLVGPIGAIVLGAIGSVIAYFFCTTVKNALGYDDSLDVFGIHGVAGIVGSIGTGIFVAPVLGGVGVEDYSMMAQVWKQVVAVVIAIVWCGIGSAILFKIVDLIVGLRVTAEREREGLDLSEHGERAYNM